MGLFKKKKASTAKEYSYREFLTLLPCCSNEQRVELLGKLEKAPIPFEICGKRLPDTLNAITYGTLDDLRAAAETADPLAEIVRIILGVPYADIYAANVVDVFGFGSFCRNELERINDMFAAIKVSYSSEEVAAGVRELDFGPFGVLDWYAKRMGITNQNEVRSVAWIRIYSCMANDAEQNNYERRLQKQYMKGER